MRFRDRGHGGKLLAKVLERFREERPVVLGLTRGGVPVALEVAEHLGASLDVIVVRKIGAPFASEYAVGAVAEGGVCYVDVEARDALGLSDDDVTALAKPELEEVARRVELYRGGEPLRDLTDETVVLVDDGVATGCTARAACRAVRARGAARVVLAAPVIAGTTEPQLRSDFDEIVAVATPPDFIAVSRWYRSFPQVSDREVLECLARAPGAEKPMSPGELWDDEWLDARERDERPRSSSEPHEVRIPVHGLRSGDTLRGILACPPEANGIVLFVHGSGSSRHSPRNQWVARVLQRRGFATLLFDLLTLDEAEEDDRTGELRFDVDLLSGRVLQVTQWIAAQPGTRDLRIGLFGASTGAAAALDAAAALPLRIAAVVARGGRPDLVAPGKLQAVDAPVRLIVGSRDEEVLDLNRRAASHLRHVDVAVIPGASHLFEERGALAAVAESAAEWFERHLAVARRAEHAAAGAP